MCGYISPETVNKSICSKNSGADQVNRVIFDDMSIEHTFDKIDTNDFSGWSKIKVEQTDRLNQTNFGIISISVDLRETRGFRLTLFYSYYSIDEELTSIRGERTISGPNGALAITGELFISLTPCNCLELISLACYTLDTCRDGFVLFGWSPTIYKLIWAPFYLLTSLISFCYAAGDRLSHSFQFTVARFSHRRKCRWNFTDCTTRRNHRLKWAHIE